MQKTFLLLITLLMASASHAVEIEILKFNDTPLANTDYRIVTFVAKDGKHVSMPLESGQTGPNGDISFKSDKAPTDKPCFVLLNNQMVGRFSYSDEAKKVTIRLKPKKGDMAPDIELIEVSTGKKFRLSELKGQAVMLDFWATWCGPCQAPMNKYNKMSQENASSWKGKFTILGVSIDSTLPPLKKHIQKKGWNSVHQTWVGPRTKGKISAKDAFKVRGVPSAFIIDKNGIIVWAGHSLRSPQYKLIETLIQDI